jgi:hypothetical protein
MTPLSAAFLGALYWSATVLAFLSAGQAVWARARSGVLGVLLFVTLTLAMTVLHLDRFHLNDPPAMSRTAAWAWVLVYLIEPPVLIAILVRQYRAPGGRPSGE